MPASAFGDFSHVRKVGVLGAGVAGMQVAEQLTAAGIRCTLFEKANDVGGVWRQNYADFGLQVPKELYEFPSYPFPATYGSFPRGPEVQEYLRSFARDKGVYEMTRLNTSVLGMAPLEDRRGWSVRFQTQGEEVAEEEFDFVVVATGMYGTPFVPTVPGMDDFTGTVMHAEKFSTKEMAVGKKVVVVGGGKSAIDCAVAAAKTAECSTLLFREVHWPVPRYLLDLIPFKWGTYSRFGHATLPVHHDVTSTEKVFHLLATPLKWIWWRIVELMFRFQFGLSGDLVPSSRIEHDLFSGGQILSYEFRDMLREGQVGALKGSIARFTPNGVVLADGTELEADMVVFGTGFMKSYAYLEPALQARLNRQKDGLYLYRNIFPTQVRDLCFIGAETSTFNNILTQGLQSLWLRRVLSGRVNLPSTDTMEATVAQDKAWKHSWMPKKGDRAAILQLHKMKYHDQLCQDMGANHKRKGWNLLAEVFAPYSAADYAGLFTEGREGSSTMLLLIASLFLAMVCLIAIGSVKSACAAGVASLFVPTLVDATLGTLRALLQFALAFKQSFKGSPLLV
jgi:dimethylaniline monooxygenase (N-oxide forming)